MPTSLRQSHAPNYRFVQFAPGDNSAWHLVVDGNGLAVPYASTNIPGARYNDLTLRSIASDGVTDGSPFQVLWNQANVPSGGTQGKTISGGGQTETLPGGLYNLMVKMSVATDQIQAEWFY